MASLPKLVIDKVYKKTDGKCAYCGNNKGKLDHHHIVFRSHGGSDNPENLILICGYMDGCKAHYHIHNGTDKDLRLKIEWTLFFYIQDLDLCWHGKIKPKKVRTIENLTGLVSNTGLEKKEGFHNKPKNVRKKSKKIKRDWKGEYKKAKRWKKSKGLK